MESAAAYSRFRMCFRISSSLSGLPARFGLLGPPDQRVSSFSQSRSSPTVPITMAASRPVPTGSPSQYFEAGLSYHQHISPESPISFFAGNTLQENSPARQATAIRKIFLLICQFICILVLGLKKRTDPLQQHAG